jgi:transcriptional regulator with XRE-family HTH domain
MEKSLFSRDYAVFLKELRAARKRVGVTQEELGRRLRQGQSFVSKCERGERRLDVIELRHFCRAMGISFAQFVEGVERAIRKSPSGGKP